MTLLLIFTKGFVSALSALGSFIGFKYNLLSFNYDINIDTELQTIEIYEEVNIIFTSLKFRSFNITHKQLRAPPIFS